MHMRNANEKILSYMKYIFVGISHNHSNNMINRLTHYN